MITFQILVDNKSFSETAEILGKSQGTISQQLKELERSLGDVKLIDRTSQKFELNSYGKILYDAITDSLDILEKGFLKVIDQSKLNRFNIEIIASSIPGQYILPKKVMQFQKTHPKVHFSVKIQNSEDALRALKDGTINLCAVGGFQSENPEEFEVKLIESDSIVIFARKNHPLFDKMDPLEELYKSPWVFREKGSATRVEFFKKFPKAEDLSIALELQDNTAIINAVEASDALAALSYHLIQITENSKIRELKVKGVTPISRNIYLVKKRGKRLRYYEQLFWGAFH